MFKDPNRELNNDDKDPNSNPLYSGMSTDPNAIQINNMPTGPSILMPVVNSQSEITPPTSPKQASPAPSRKSGGVGLFAKIKALSFSTSGNSNNESSSISSSTTTATAATGLGGSTSPTGSALSHSIKQKPKFILSRIRENRLTRREVISDSNEMCIKKLV